VSPSVRKTGRRFTLLALSLLAICIGVVECLASSDPAPKATSSPGYVGGEYIVAQAADTPSPTPTEEDIPKNPVPAGASGAAAASVDQISFKTPWEVYLAGFTVLLGVGFIGMFCFVNRNETRDHTFSRNFIILTVIFAALFLIVAGYSEQQTAPVFGLLGTIVGYLFGAVVGKAQAQIDAGVAARRPAQDSGATVKP